ncbi:hypothetical protein SADUNF_Sadunf08G0176500 [Salix dunnii]|uniref:Uncharacterized protein n=1 Tax=Salix dunnii TaxID=1413687 RepID=A0A835N1Z2_9ROSI|nr:hypothetical protein SADUNF_Sadunf08G0176500 [Salix dunnii]
MQKMANSPETNTKTQGVDLQLSENLIIVEDGDECGRRDWKSDPDISGANGCIEAYRDKMLFRKCGVSQVQEEGSKPGEMPR